MKILNIILVTGIVLVVIGIFYRASQDDDTNQTITDSTNTVILSLDTNLLTVENGNVYILEGISQEDVLNNIISEDGSSQTYRIATSEGSNKTKDELYEYDRLYVMAETGANEVYYTILFSD